jgi:hypothetical protein
VLLVSILAAPLFFVVAVLAGFSSNFYLSVLCLDVLGSGVIELDFTHGTPLLNFTIFSMLENTRFLASIYSTI